MRFRLTVLAALAVLAAPAHAQVSFHAIWGSGLGDIWAVGGNGAAAHFSGGAWSMVPTGMRVELRAVWGSGPGDVYAAGDGGALVHWNGTAWSTVATGVTRDLVAIAGCSASDVTVLGQSGDEREQPLVLHFDGRTWTSSQRLGVAARAAGLVAACPGLVFAGASYFDPKPNERRNVGVVARVRAGTWTLSGWNGQHVTDPMVGGTSWSRIAGGGGTIALMGIGDNGERAIVVSSRAGGWTRVPAPTDLPRNADLDRAAFGVADGAPVLVFRDGFARWVGGQWQVVTAETRNAGMEDASRQMQALNLRQGQVPTPEQIRQIQQIQQAALAQMGNIQAMAQRAMALQLGDDPAIWAPASGGFYVATEHGRVVRITGDDARVAFDQMCLNPSMASMPQCQAPTAPASSMPTPVRRPKAARARP
jgi:hypothetical protein